MAKRAKMTVGERIQLDAVREALLRPDMTLDEFRSRSALDGCRKSARRIDAAIRKAANAAAWDVKLNQPNESSYAWTEAKYGPRPAKKARRQ